MLLSFSRCYPFLCLLGVRVLCFSVGKVAFVCYSSSLRSSLICLAWEQNKLAQVLNSNLISECLYWRKFRWKKTHLKKPIELHEIKTLTKLLYCSVTQETNMLLLKGSAAIALHIALIYSTTLLWSSAATKLQVWAREKLSWREPTGQHSENSWETIANAVLNAYTKTRNHRKTLRKTQKSNILKPKE